ncbi:MAG: hypothetical protein A2817_01185 [Candidatus Yanofskybacteria bacterium RIFCSPHIGHO2_01_FULL_39_8b]|uniref:Transketolase N-terminal domain-containing protein n=1 Tax=Candidatus Yanofskybacteria bacterium RIFCSPHIGHO2_01_FULL_39_8b TaxID=1802659 RepID=A0A1F8EFE7_9BACT|nr:hypothetical protein [uncultured bacterium]OGM99551.1 MAG: hypothetical protein A2817_01185 [Candidatus Yanofskybacteria bacterium RIFCSPHIGHO2_01_FULL_39_8b]
MKKLSHKLQDDLKRQALNIRRDIITISAKAGSTHIGSLLSTVDILTALYFDILRIDPKKPNNSNRDRFILSKGHGCLGLYCTLANRGFISKKILNEYCKDGSTLPIHPVRGSVPGIEATTGSLGHGLGMGLGLALARKRDNESGRVFVLLSDGECDEGSTWEAVMLAGHLKTDNLIAIVDYNKIQCYGHVKDILDLEPFTDKWRANGWEAIEVNGHKFEELIPALRSIPSQVGKPTVIIAHTARGKGVPSMENKLEWYYYNIKSENLDKILAELI